MVGLQSLQGKLESTHLTGDTRHKIIVGIDYGTTFSGISYVTTDKSDIEDINIISAWPGEPHTTWKTPTRIAYARENEKMKGNKWGFEVHPKHISYSWTKLMLDKNAAVAEYDDPALSKMFGQGMMRVPHFRDAEGVCEDFLRELFLHLSTKLRQQISTLTYDITPMECWITLPAIWSEEAKDATLQAARRAGFGSRPGDEIFTIAEPEAAAIATLKKYSGPDVLNPVKPNDHILICDCGGGTVDITTYTITQVQPFLDFDELCVGVGGKCGSTYIDRNLHALLSKRFGAAFDNLPFAQKGPGSKFMSRFETVKRNFGFSDDLEEQELSPLKLDVPDSEYYDVEERSVKLTNEDMQSLFNPVVAEITKMVGEQVKEAKEKRGAVIDRIILVGGFGESLYLNKALEEWCQNNEKITLMCPEHSQSAVVRGAALRGLEGIAPRMKRARRHYGFILCKPFRESKDPEATSYIDDYDDVKHCNSRMEWVVSKGEEVFQDTFRTIECMVNYTPGKDWSSRFKLYSCALNDPPEYYTDPRVEEVGSIISSLDKDFLSGVKTQVNYNVRLGKLVHKLPHQVQVRFGDKGDNLTFRILVNKNVVSTAVIDFNRH